MSGRGIGGVRALGTPGFRASLLPGKGGLGAASFHQGPHAGRDVRLRVPGRGWPDGAEGRSD